MRLFDWLRAPPRQDPTQQARLAALPAPLPWQATHSVAQQRWVVVDVETSGLSLTRDEVLSIGAVAIENGAISLRASFQCTLAREHRPGPSVLLHGLGPNALAAGVEPAEALLSFLDYVGDSPLLAYHAPFDQQMLARAMKHSLGYRWQPYFLDVAELAPMLFPDGPRPGSGLDDWIAHMGLHIAERHHAVADAQVTAEIALMLFAYARRDGIDTPQALAQRLEQWRRRQAQPRM